MVVVISEVGVAEEEVAVLSQIVKSENVRVSFTYPRQGLPARHDL